MCARSMGCLTKWRWRCKASPMPNHYHRASPSTQPMLSMRPLWPTFRQIYAAVSGTPSSAGSLSRGLTPTRCWPTRTAGFWVDAGVRTEGNDRAALVLLLCTHRHRYFGELASNSPHRAAVRALAAPMQQARAAPAQSGTGVGAPGLVVCRGTRSQPRPNPCHPNVHWRTSCGRC